MSEYTGVLRLLFEWQTIITGAAAIAAALIAACPVWRQVRALNIQSAGLLRDVLARRITDIELRRNATQAALSKITTKFLGELYGADPEGEQNVNTEWAAQAEQIVDRVIATLTSDQESRLDDQSTDIKRTVVIQAAKALSECLYEIHVPWSTDLEDPEWNLTKDEITEVTGKGKDAEKKLMDRISALSGTASDLDQAFLANLDRLRNRLRTADNIVVKHKLVRG